MIKYYILILLMSFVGSIASLFLKKASANLDFKKLFFNFNLYVGGTLYLLSAIINIYVLKYMEYSKVLPLTSFTYVITLILSGFLLKEKISRKKIMGVLLIIIGAIFISF